MMVVLVVVVVVVVVLLRLLMMIMMGTMVTTAIRCNRIVKIKTGNKYSDKTPLPPPQHLHQKFHVGSS